MQPQQKIREITDWRFDLRFYDLTVRTAARVPWQPWRLGGGIFAMPGGAAIKYCYL